MRIKTNKSGFFLVKDMEVRGQGEGGGKYEYSSTIYIKNTTLPTKYH